MNRNIECIQRLLEINHSYDEICEWLEVNKFIEAIEAAQLTRSQERAEYIYNTLLKNKKNDNIILLYFEWNILPLETIKITCVTDKEEKFFTYGF